MATACRAREDDFPLDPAASLDSDGDGHPDAWNPGMGPGDSTTGLVLDAFPLDSACWLPEHGTGGVCDIAGAIPPYDPAEIAMGVDDVVYLFSPGDERIHRWSAAGEQYLNPIVIGAGATHMAYSATTHRLYLAYPSGAITQIDLATSLTEAPFAAAYDAPSGLTTAGEFVVAVHRTSGWAVHYSFDPNGSLVSYDELELPLARLRLEPRESPSVLLRRQRQQPSDALRRDRAGWHHRRPAGGRELLGAASGAPHSPLTRRRTRLDRHRAALRRRNPRRPRGAAGGRRRRSLDGRRPDPHRARGRRRWNLAAQRGPDLSSGRRTACPARRAGCSRGAAGRGGRDMAGGAPAFHPWEPLDDVDGDGTDNFDDAFPTDPAASLDGDGDGAPDEWNPGMGPGDSTTGLVLDAFPFDFACQLPEHGVGGICDFALVVPADPATPLCSHDDLGCPARERFLLRRTRQRFRPALQRLAPLRRPGRIPGRGPRSCLWPPRPLGSPGRPAARLRARCRGEAALRRSVARRRGGGGGSRHRRRRDHRSPRLAVAALARKRRGPLAGDLLRGSRLPVSPAG